MDIPEHILTAKEAAAIADNSVYLFDDIMKHIRECAMKNEKVLIYALPKLYISKTALEKAEKKLEELGYKLEKQYSSCDIRVEW